MSWDALIWTLFGLLRRDWINTGKYFFVFLFLYEQLFIRGTRQHTRAVEKNAANPGPGQAKKRRVTNKK